MSLYHRPRMEIVIPPPSGDFFASKLLCIFLIALISTTSGMQFNSLTTQLMNEAEGESAPPGNSSRS